MDSLARYTVELQRPGGGWAELRELTARARQAADDMRRDGEAVRFLRSVFVPEDDACFLLYEGPNARVVRDAALRARLRSGQVRPTLGIDH